MKIALARLGILVGGTLAALAISTHSHRPCPEPAVVVYEDGSGVQYVGDQEVRTFPDGTFVWPTR